MFVILRRIEGQVRVESGDRIQGPILCSEGNVFSLRTSNFGPWKSDDGDCVSLPANLRAHVRRAHELCLVWIRKSLRSKFAGSTNTEEQNRRARTDSGVTRVRGGKFGEKGRQVIRGNSVTSMETLEALRP